MAQNLDEFLKRTLLEFRNLSKNILSVSNFSSFEASLNDQVMLTRTETYYKRNRYCDFLNSQKPVSEAKDRETYVKTTEEEIIIQ